MLGDALVSAWCGEVRNATFQYGKRDDMRSVDGRLTW